MKTLIAVAFLALAGLVYAEDPVPSQSAGGDTPLAKDAKDSSKADAKKDAADDKLPSPGDLIKKLKAAQEKDDKKSKVAYFDFTRPVEDRPADFSLFGSDENMTLRSIVERMHKARDDKDVKGVLITLGAGSGVNYSQAQELRDTLAELKKAGKETFVYADSFDTPSYTMATGASHICMLEGGELMIPGVGLQTMFYKGLFDKLGVKADYVQIGEYKGAEEEYTRTEPSPELKGELAKLTDGLYEQIVDGIAANRNLSKFKVQELIDQTILTGKAAKEAGLVDELLDEDGLRKLMTKKLGNEISLLPDYGRSAREAVDFSNPMGLLAVLLKKPQPTSDKPQIALIYADGVIVDGDGEDSNLFSEAGVASESIRKALRIATRDDDIKAIVIRIDSPGGSALASEVMWQAVRHAADKKPVIISVGSMAASGGYYLASAGDRIFADPSAIVGSIGVVGGKFVFKDLYGKLGIGTQQFSKGANAGLFSSDEPWSDRQRQMVTAWMKQTYDQFTERVMTTRAGKIKDIDKVARGRIFLAKQAKELGMVDELGSLDDTIVYAAKKGGLNANGYDIRVLPAPKTLIDILTGGGPDAAMPFQPHIQIKADQLLGGVSPEAAKLFSREFRMLQLLQKRPVVLVSPYTVTIK
ncbi:MAG TPA: signal peptide peptidase SppA [Humisphaera sp.]|jgi:protease-4|nr:signal peptide peptidase SppA [Humisphaera sp.]